MTGPARRRGTSIRRPKVPEERGPPRESPLSPQVEAEAGADTRTRDLVHPGLQARHLERARRVGARRVDRAAVTPQEDPLAAERIVAAAEEREGESDGVPLGDDGRVDLGLRGEDAEADRVRAVVRADGGWCGGQLLDAEDRRR